MLDKITVIDAINSLKGATGGTGIKAFDEAWTDGYACAIDDMLSVIGNLDAEKPDNLKRSFFDYVNEMRGIADSPDLDEESAHINADDLMCRLLLQLGFVDVVDEFNRVTKWYG
jgi:hypothetical protein